MKNERKHLTRLILIASAFIGIIGGTIVFADDAESASLQSSDIIGVWNPTTYEGEMAFREDGSGHYHDDSWDYDISWSFNEGSKKITIVYPGNISANFDVSQIPDGGLEAISEDRSLTLVKDLSQEESSYVPDLIADLEDPDACNYDEKEFSLSYDHCELAKMSDGTEVVVVVFDFKNKYNDSTSFFNTINTEAYQNLIQVLLPDGVFYGADTGMGLSMIYMNNATKQLLNGGELQVGAMFPVGGKSPITVKMDEKRYWGDGEWTGEFVIKFQDPNVEETEESSTEQDNTEITDKEKIKSAQEMLAQKGYDIGSPDGIAGAKTTEAIKQFQKENGLEQTGVLTESLLALLSK